MKYCEDVDCPNLAGDECLLGFQIRFRTPKSMSEAVKSDCGHVMPKPCRVKFRRENPGKYGKNVQR